LDRHAEREPGAVVARVLVREPLGDGLRALEAPARVEVGALAAGVDRNPAVRALLERRGGDRQDRAARPAPGDGSLGEHPAAPRRVGGRRLPFRRRALLVPVPSLTVLAIGHVGDLRRQMLHHFCSIHDRWAIAALTVVAVSAASSSRPSRSSHWRGPVSSPFPRSFAGWSCGGWLR